MSTNPSFSQEKDEYVVLKLPLRDYIGTKHIMPPTIAIADASVRHLVRKDEQRLLKMYFRHWQSPYLGHLPGWRSDSAQYVLCNGKLVGGLYLCERNEFTNERDWGQLHYFFMEPEFKGQGLHSLLFSEALRRAKSWGLEGVFINTDRHGLPEVYERWGAKIWRRLPKSVHAPRHFNLSHHNWLVYRIHDEALAKAIRDYASGVLVDIGCGVKPYATLTQCFVSRHIGVDHLGSQHENNNVDVFATAYDTTLQSGSADTVLCTTVLEHLEWPDRAIKEMQRILKPGGHAILTAPLFWHLHEQPRDFFRYTEFGLAHLLKQGGFQVVEIKPLSGFLVTFAQELSYYIHGRGGRFFHLPVRLAQYLLQRFAYYCHRTGRDTAHGFTWAYLVVAKKAEHGVIS